MATLAQKKAVVEDITGNLQKANALYLVNYSGISVDQVNTLRALFREEGITYKVYKNTLMERAMKEVGGYDSAFEHLEEQNAFIFTDEDLGKPAKILKKYIKENNKPEFKMAIIEGQVFKSDQLDQLAALKSKNEIIGDIMGLLLSPIQNVISGLQAQGSNILGAVKEIAEKEQ